MWGTFWRTLGRRISLIFMVADLLLPAYCGKHSLQLVSTNSDRMVKETLHNPVRRMLGVSCP